MSTHAIQIRSSSRFALAAAFLLVVFSGLPFPLTAWVYYHGSGGGGGPYPMDLDLVAHEANDVYLMVSNQGPIGNNIQTGNGAGHFPRGTGNNYIFGTGLWIGGIADVDGNGEVDSVLTQAYVPQFGNTEHQEGRVGQSPSDPLARVFNSFDPNDLLEWPPEFSFYDPGIGDTIPLIYSTQDLVTIYNAVDGDPVIGIGNLPVEVHQRSMAFIGEGIGQVIYAIFDLTNASGETPQGPYPIEDAWIGFDSDMDIGATFSDDMTSVLFEQVVGPDTVTLDMGIAWDYNFDESNFTEIPGFVGVHLLQSPGNPYDGIDNDGDGVIDESAWNGIDDDGDGETDEPDEVDELGLVSYSKHCSPSVPCGVTDPETDEDGYALISCGTGSSPIECHEGIDPSDVRFMISSGPFDWLPDETIRFAMAIVFAEPVGQPTHLELLGDPPRPDPNDPVLANLVEVTRTIREFWFTGFEGYATPLDILWTTDIEDTNDPIGPYEVLTSVVDSVGIHSVGLFTSVDGGPFEEVPMTWQPINIYSAEIPGLPFGTSIRYFIQAVDSLFSVVRDPESAPLETYGFEILDAPTFTDVTREVGMRILESAQAAVWFDYDLDGDDDLYVMGAGVVYLYRNDGDSLFSDVTAEAGVGGINFTGVQTADYDNDGDPDLYTVSYAQDNVLFQNWGDGTFVDVAEEAGVDIRTGSGGAVWGDYDRDGYLDLFVFGHNNFTPVLYRNAGDGTFEDVTDDAGVTEVTASMSRAATFFDRDRDGDLDIYLVTEGSNVLFDNNGNGTFTDRTSMAGLDDDGIGMNLALVDHDSDGDVDLYVVNNGSNRLFRNDGDGTFQDVAADVGLDDIGKEFSAFADVNLDGYTDLLTSAPGLLISHRGESFSDRTDFGGIDLGYDMVILSDYDEDGHIDLFNAYLYRNNGYPVDIGRNWLTVELEGIRSPRDGTGSVVEVVTDDLRQVKVCGEGTGNSMGSLPVEFGLDSALVVNSVIVRWTSGIVQELSGLAANQVVHVIEDTTLTGIGSGSGGAPVSLPRAFALTQNYPNPFNPSTTIRYDIPVSEGSNGLSEGEDSGGVPVRLYIYDIRGRLVRKLVDRERDPGRYIVHWDGRNDRGQPASSGVYLYRLEAGDFVSTRKMVMVR